jgi:Ser-tRNA(Ala) deacylase AlaX
MIPIYRTDPYLHSIETILDAVQEEDGYQLVTCRELIFAEGGGQPRDFGTVSFGGKISPVLELIKIKGDVRLKIEKIEGLKKGAVVVASIDGERRKAIMRLHSTQHALAGSLRSFLPDYETGGMGITPDANECTMKFRSEMSKGEEDLSKAIEIVKGAVQRNVKVEATVFDNLDEAKKKFGDLYRPSDPRVQIKGKVRIVHIDGIDANSCGGTHVRELGEIGEVRAELSSWDGREGVVRIW